MMSGQWPATLGVLDNSQWFPAGTGGLEGRCPVWPEAVTGAGYRTAGIGKMHFTPWDARLGFVERITAEDKRQYFWPDDYEKFLRANGIAKHHPTGLPGYFETLQASVFRTPSASTWTPTSGIRRRWIARYGGAGQPRSPRGSPSRGPMIRTTLRRDGFHVRRGPHPRAHPGPRRGGRAAAQGGRCVQSPLYQLDLSQATAEHYRRWRAHYYANITLIDEGIGKILGALEETGALERTLIVFTSDHGDALGDHGLAYKSAFYESIAHVPLLVRGPGVTPGGRCPALISTLDLVPLFYRTCGLEPPPVVQGIDPTPLLRDPSAPGRSHVYSELQGRAMVRDERFKYVHYRDGECELYDLPADPTEERNLAPDPAYTGELARLRGLLVEHAMENSACRAVAAHGSRHGTATGLSATTPPRPGGQRMREEAPPMPRASPDRPPDRPPAGRAHRQRRLL